MPKQVSKQTPARAPSCIESKKLDRIDIVVKPQQGAKTGGWRVNKPVVDEQKCIACGTCERVCPDASITVQPMPSGPSGKRAARVDYDYCKGCGICANECPVKCIAMVEEK